MSNKNIIKYGEFSINKSINIEKVNGITLIDNNDEEGCYFDFYHLNVKINLDLDWSKISNEEVLKYINDETEIISYYTDDDLDGFKLF